MNQRWCLLSAIALLSMAWGLSGCAQREEPPNPPPRRRAPVATPKIDPAVTKCLEALPTVEKLPIKSELPPLLTTFCEVSSREIKDSKAWEWTRRPELLGLFSHYVYGLSPTTPKNDAIEIKVSRKDGVLGGKANRKMYELTLKGTGETIHLLVYIPTSKTPVPLMLGLNFFGNHSTIDDPDVPLSKRWLPSRGKGVKEHKATESSRGTVVERWSIKQNIEAGFAIATIYHGDFDLDQPDGKNWVHQYFGATENIRKKPESGGTINAWAWGLSRAMDVLQQDEDIDGKRIWVMGHSRNGKAALLAAARDVRFAGVISNQSGSMGAAVNRGKTGETIKTIQPFFPHWFNETFAAFVPEPDRLPVDQHLLLALIAPRPLLIATATADKWADPEAAWRSVLAAQPAWSFLGKQQPVLDKTLPKELTLTGKDIAYHRRPGGHSVIADDWKVFRRFASP